MRPRMAVQTRVRHKVRDRMRVENFFWSFMTVRRSGEGVKDGEGGTQRPFRTVALECGFKRSA